MLGRSKAAHPMWTQDGNILPQYPFDGSFEIQSTVQEAEHEPHVVCAVLDWIAFASIEYIANIRCVTSVHRLSIRHVHI